MGRDLVRRASTVCVVRETARLEVLMVRRTLDARFMPGMWVFPGGALDDSDANPPPAFGPPPVDVWRVAALREMIEETGIWLTSDGIQEHGVTEDAFGDVIASGVMLDPARLIYFANWITPAVFPIGFDTRFFLAHVDSDTEGAIDGDELIDLAWVPASEVIDRERRGDWDLAYPTRQTLDLLSDETSVERLTSRLRSIEKVEPVQPRLLVSESDVRLITPDEPEWDAAEAAQTDPTILQRMTAVLERKGVVPAEFRHGS
ncbi:MAG: NUDIX hydrolase [Acidimicrobiia bacterium]|nr:NUDIX hydrolase [Acidimicrobiia bacterium]